MGSCGHAIVRLDKGSRPDAIVRRAADTRSRDLHRLVSDAPDRACAEHEACCLVDVDQDAVLWYRITAAAKSVADAPAAVYQLAMTSLRNSIGRHDLDEVLQERDKIDDLLRKNIEGLTGQWGIEVNASR